MPELPEVEAARRALEEHCTGKTILKCTVADDAKVIDGVSPAELQSALAGRTILSVHRKGKHLWLCLDSPPFPCFQFGMTGEFYIKGVAVTKYKRSAVSSTDDWPSKFSKVFLELDDSLEVSFTDKRRFARVRLLDDPETTPAISDLGPDALFEPMQVDDFVVFLSKRHLPIKALLLDQGFISGIGNWVADEVLYQARIHPQQTASMLSKENCESLHRSIKEVLEKALEVGADSSQFPNNWIFHSREKKRGNAYVDGKTIEFITSAGRTSAYVPELQKLRGKETGKVATSRSKKLKTNGPAKDGSEEEAVDEDDEATTKPTKTETAKEGTQKRQRRAGHSDGGGVQPPKAAKGTTKKQVKAAKAAEEPPEKRSKSSQSGASQRKKTRK